MNWFMNAPSHQIYTKKILINAPSPPDLALKKFHFVLWSIFNIIIILTHPPVHKSA